MDTLKNSRLKGGWMEDTLRQKHITFPIGGATWTIRPADGDSEDALRFAMLEGDSEEALLSYWATQVVTVNGQEDLELDDRVDAIKDLFTFDQEFLAIECYLITHGNEFEPHEPCPKCHGLREKAVNLQLQYRPLPEGVTPGNPTFEVFLPESGQTARIGYVTLEEAMALSDDPTEREWARVKSLDGRDKISVDEIRQLGERDRKALRRGLQESRYGYNPFIRYRCDCGESEGNPCGHIIHVNLLAEPGFFWSGQPAPQLPPISD